MKRLRVNKGAESVLAIGLADIFVILGNVQIYMFVVYINLALVLGRMQALLSHSSNRYVLHPEQLSCILKYFLSSGM